MEATHFLMLPKVATEMALHVLAYNLTRVMNIVGIKRLLVAILPFRSLSVPRGCARIDYRLATAKTCSNGRVDVDRHRLRAVFCGGKTFSHGLDHRLN
jgi:hypothetical protein